MGAEEKERKVVKWFYFCTVATLPNVTNDRVYGSADGWMDGRVGAAAAAVFLLSRNVRIVLVWGGRVYRN